MNNLFPFIFFCSINSIYSAPTTEKCSVEKCQPHINSLNDYIIKYPFTKSTSITPPADAFKNITEQCPKTLNCLSSLKCKEGEDYKVQYNEYCLEIEVRVSEFQTDCLPNIFSAIYDEKMDCVKKFDFLSNNLTKKREAFTNGKTCILEIAQEECEAPGAAFIKKRYDEFVSALTSTPKHDKCWGLHYELNQQQCVPLAFDLKEKMDELKTNDVPLNDTRVPEVVKLCRKTEKCTNENCLFGEKGRKDIKDACDVLDLASSSFSACLNKITREKPDFKKYTCLKGIDFNNEDKNNVCEKFHLKADCVKTLMEDFCGKDIINDYQKMVGILVAQFKCK